MTAALVTFGSPAGAAQAGQVPTRQAQTGQIQAGQDRASLANAGRALDSQAQAARVAAAAAGGTVKGVVFQDFGTSGFYTTGNASAGVPRNRPVGGVTATAYDADGATVGTATSGSDGTYTINVSGAKSSYLRVQFSGWDRSVYQPGFAAQSAVPAGSLGENDTSVQFVQLGTADANHVDLSLVIPDQVIQGNAPIATAIQYAGDPSNAGTLTTSAALVAQPWADYGASEDPAWPFDRVTLATFGQVGSIWGTSYIRPDNMMVASPSVKRMSGLSGTGGTAALGKIWRVTNVLKADGTLNSSTPAPSVWFDVANLTVVGGGGATVDLGTIGTNSARGLGDHTSPAKDLDGFTKSGTVGIGGMATSLDGRAMFIANLHDKSVYGIPLPADISTKPEQALKIPTPVGADQQLWALTTYRGRIYLGYVDTGARPGQAASAAGLKAYVVSIGTEEVVRAVVKRQLGAVAWRPEITVDLGYRKGSNMENWPTRGGNLTTATSCNNGQPNAGSPNMDQSFPQITRWNTWTDSWSWNSTGGAVDTDNPFNGSVQSGGGTVGLPGGCSYGTGWEQVYPQPVLSGITFDIDGYMILGFTDRSALQSGNRNYAAVSAPTSGRYWESISNGDTLIAAPRTLAPAGCPAGTDETFVLECQGKVGSRPQRTAAAGNPSQNPTHNNNEGPGGGEFLNDRRDQGTGGNHNENTLGSVVTYPGVDEIAATAMDPYSGINRNGLMWFNQNNGVATRGFDQVVGDQNNQSGTFQKGGGLGSVALLGVAAPVEIGNRVWLDADLNGRQDPDEPAINRAPVELWTATEAAPNTPVCKIGETATATVDGQPGTYYFRSDDAELEDVACSGHDPVSFTPNGNYVVVFPPGTGLVQVRGPNAVHRGFDGLTWADLQRTTQTVSIAPTSTNGGTNRVNDSDPDVSDGRAPVTVGGPGENDHTIDAGWYGVAPYRVVKTTEGTSPSGQTYTVTVTGAINFRGDDRLTTAGSDPGGRDPEVAKKAFVLSPGTPVASGQDLPYGYELTLKETDPDLPADAVTYKPADPDNPDQARVIIEPRLADSAVVTLNVTNSYGAFQIIKSLDGDDQAQAKVSDLEFTVTWTSDHPDSAGGNTSGTITVKGDQIAAPEPALWFPVGTEVTLSEATPTNLPPGVKWTGGTWTADPPNVIANSDGTATVTIVGNDQVPLKVELTNTVENALGNVTITKQATGDFPDLTDPIYATVSIPFTYSYTIPGETPVTGQTFALTQANNFTVTSPDFPTGTTFTVTEGTPTGLPPNLTMDFQGWSGSGVTADGQTASFTIGDGTTIAAVVTNSTTEGVGTFEVTKAFQDAAGDPIDPDDPRLAPVVVTVTWTAPDGQSGTIALNFANGFTAGPIDGAGDPVTFPLGTVISLEETGFLPDPLPPGVVVSPVAWSPADPGDPSKGQVTVSDETQPAQAILVNGASIVPGTFAIHKELDGDFDLDDPQLEDASFTVLAHWAARPDIGQPEGSVTLLLNQENNWSAELGKTLAVGTVVTLSEPEAGGLPPDVGWDGEPAWSGDGITDNGDGTATLTIAESETVPSFVVTNTLTKLTGTFGVAKELSGDFDFDSPELDGVSFTVHASWPASVGQPAGSTDLVLDEGNNFTATYPDELATGTVVTLSEIEPSGTPPSVDWSDITWSGDGMTVNPDGSASFVVGDGTSPTFTVTNTVLKLTGTFGVAKKLDGDFDLDSPELADLSYTVTASWPAGPGLEAGSLTGALDAGNGFSQDAGIYLPTGTVVTLSEVKPSGTPPQVGWGAITWSGPGLTDNGDGTASFTIGDDTSPEFTVTNTATKRTGTFGVSKKLTGDFDLTSPEIAGLTFTVKAAWLPAPGLKAGTVTMTLNAANNFSAESGVQLPTGTQVLLDEVDPTGAPPDVRWDDVTWSGEGLKNNPNGTVTFTVGAGTAPQFTVTNAATKLTGTFEVAKVVGGDFHLFAPAVIDTTYTVVASWPAGPGDDAGSVVLTLDQDNAFRADSGVVLPTGTVVTLTERSESGADPSVDWVDRGWSGEGLTVNQDGTASFVIGDGTDGTMAGYQAVDLADELTGSLSLTKEVIGPGAGSVPADTTFTVNYTYEGLALVGPGSVTLVNGQTVGVTGVPAGTVVTLSEAAPTDPSVSWGTPVFVLPDGSSSPGSITVTVGADQAVAIVLQNPANAPHPPMPNTGVDAVGMGLTGLTFIASGLALLWLASTRRRSRRFGVLG